MIAFIVISGRPPEPFQFFLAFDHRREFARSVWGTVDLDAAAVESIRNAKRTIFNAALSVVSGDPSAASSIGILVDEEFGADVAVDAARAGIPTAMPVEIDERAVFDWAFGADWKAHVSQFTPTYAKVLVRYNVGGSIDENRIQAERLSTVSQWLSGQPSRFMFELVVAPTTAQLEQAERGNLDFERDVRPGLIVRAIEELQDAGVEPDVWKLEGIEQIPQAREVVNVARRGEHRSHVTCVVLGAGKEGDRISQWLSVAAHVDGYSGFAIGRSIWRDPIRRQIAGTLSPKDATNLIAARYSELVAMYRGFGAAAAAARN